MTSYLTVRNMESAKDLYSLSICPRILVSQQHADHWDPAQRKVPSNTRSQTAIPGSMRVLVSQCPRHGTSTLCSHQICGKMSCAIFCARARTAGAESMLAMPQTTLPPIPDHITTKHRSP
eukprot:1112158-Rhodomonas_salina.1